MIAYLQRARKARMGPVDSQKERVDCDLKLAGNLLLELFELDSLATQGRTRVMSSYRQARGPCEREHRVGGAQALACGRDEEVRLHRSVRRVQSKHASTTVGTKTTAPRCAEAIKRDTAEKTATKH